MEKPPDRDQPYGNREISGRQGTEDQRIKELEEKLKDVSKWLEAEVGLKTLELHEKNLELEQANKKLESLNRTKNEFLRIISHEIRTPLNGMLGATSLLRGMANTDEQKEFFELFDLSVRRLESFANTAFRIAELHALNHQLPREAVNLQEILDEIIMIIGFGQHRRTLATDIGKGVGTIMVNRALFISALAKIFENSVRFSPPGSTISVKITAEADGIHFVISDQSPGFPGEVLLRKFEPFVTGVTHIDQNPGMSLSIVKFIIEGHGGKIDIYNGKPSGAVVDFFIP